jgi:hypothetical protein
MQVEVFKTDICHGEQESCKECVVARAINRKLPEKYFSIVHHGYYNVAKRVSTVEPFDVDYQLVRRVPFSRTVTKYIRRFDKNKKSVLPTVLNIEVPTLP